MAANTDSQATRRLVDFLGELGPRWGLPSEACRVHGYLYLADKPVAEDELSAAVGLDGAALRQALTWLADYGLAAHRPPAAWRTDSDPWDLMMHALEERRRRELGPALEALRDCRRLARAETGQNPAIRRQIDKLLALAEDLAAIDTQAQRLSPKTLRQMVGLGGRAARLLDRTFGGKQGR